jgi:hypothetical protein
VERAKEKKRFDKISKACDQALQDELEYIWIDTCCINKSSSAELSEAINPMFAWYKRSEKCYAYLADVGDGGEGLRASKWFTKTWTLQELLAPSYLRSGGEPGGMEFFSSQWKSLGTKSSLSGTISSVTGISVDFLTGQSLYTASISMRMSWAAERRATRAEDIAYSLLGIFDVNMPLLYGEGKVKAFWRLQEEIMKTSEDETLFAWESMELAGYTSPGDALASDPRDFGEARHLVPFTSDDPIVPYALTHRGLRIWLQLSGSDTYLQDIRPLRSPVMIISSYNLQVVILRCHVAHDFSYAVVTPLHHVRAILYVRDPTTYVSLIPVRHLATFKPIEGIYIRNSRVCSILHNVSRRFGFLIRSLPSSFQILKASPPDFWNEKDRIVQGHSDVQGFRHWHASLALASESRSLTVPTTMISS